MNTVNEAQREYWRTRRAWVEQQEQMDLQLGVFGVAAMDALQEIPNMDVLDVGCGCGHTTQQLKDRVGEGRVVGVDISDQLLDAARRRNRGEVEFLEADAQVDPLQGPYDIIFSRFGVMFFDDPVAAFSNIRQAVRPGGRMTYVCWADRKANPWIRIPAGAAKAFLDLPAPPPDDAPGQFAMENEGRVQQILHDAGWTDIRLERFTIDGSIGSDAADAASFITKMGPMSEPFALADLDTQNKTLQVIEEALTPYANDSGVVLGFSTWIVSAMQT